MIRVSLMACYKCHKYSEKVHKKNISNKATFCDRVRCDTCNEGVGPSGHLYEMQIMFGNDSLCNLLKNKDGELRAITVAGRGDTTRIEKHQTKKTVH